MTARKPTGGPKNPATQRNGTLNKKLRAEVLRIYGRTCHICGGRIDLSLKFPDPMSYEVDHLVPVAKGGPMYDARTCRPAHRRHNGQRGSRSVAYGREAITKKPRSQRRAEAAKKAPKRKGRPPWRRRQDPPPPGWGTGKPAEPTIERTFPTSQDWCADLTHVTDLTW